MFRIEKRKVPQIVGLMVVLIIISIAIVMVIDAHFALDPWGDGDVTMLWYFLMGSIFFPGALRRYRVARQAEQKVSWYHRPDLILCLIGLVSGLIFALSVVQKWFEFVFINDTGSPHSVAFTEGFLLALVIIRVVLYLCWIGLLIVLICYTINQSRQRKKMLRQPSKVS